jgi:phosphatidylinositol alpha-1,6-mannosyltransferase
MRVLALVTEAFGGRGGIARFCQDLIEVLSRSKEPSEIFVLPRLVPEKVESLPHGVTQARPASSKCVYAFKALWTFLSRRPINLIFCGHIHLLPLACVLGRFTKIPVWAHLYGIEAWEKLSRLDLWGVTQCDLITAASRFTRRRFLSHANISPEKVRVLPCLVREKFQPGPKPSYLMDRYQLHGKKILLTLSRISAQDNYKGHERVLNIMPDICKAVPTAVYVIAGDGSGLPPLQKLAREKRLNGKVIFTGHVSEEEIVDHYRLADVFVMPSTGEGFGIVLLEAAACGIPVVAGRTDGSVDALSEGKLGLLVDIQDGQHLAQAIIRQLKGHSARRNDGSSSPFRFPQIIQNFADYVSSLSSHVQLK